MVSEMRQRAADLMPASPVARRIVLAVVVVVLGIVAAAVLGLGPWSDDDAVEPRLDSIETPAVDVVDRWNETVAAREVGDLLPELTWTRDEDLVLDVAEHVFGSWGAVTLYRHPDERLAAVDLLGSYVTPEDRVRMSDTVIAAVSAVSGLPLEEIEPFVAEDLGFGGPEGPPGGSAELDGVRYTVERTTRTAQLRITTASTPIPD